jgi:hypothetical protein
MPSGILEEMIRDAAEHPILFTGCEVQGALPHKAVTGCEVQGALPHKAVTGCEVQGALPHKAVTGCEVQGALPHKAVTGSEVPRALSCFIAQIAFPFTTSGHHLSIHPAVINNCRIKPLVAVM